MSENPRRMAEEVSLESPWFCDPVTYQGTAKVAWPDGLVLEGDAECTAGPTDTRASLVIKRAGHPSHGDRLTPFDIAYFAMGESEGPQLWIRTTTGTLRCSSAFLLSATASTTTPYSTAAFAVYDATYEADGEPRSPAYWVAPLVNFVYSFPHAGPELRAHPLRHWRPPSDLPSNGERNRSLTESLSSFRDMALAFQWRHHVVHVEPLPGYREAVSLLKSGQTRGITTATMVGEMPRNGGTTWNEVRDWIPAMLIRSLGFATGGIVAGHFVELRASDGALILRHHMPMGMAEYSPSECIIPQHDPASLGSFVSLCAEASEQRGETVSLLVGHLQNAVATRNSFLELSLFSLFCAYEILFDLNGIEAADLGRSLDPARLGEVRAALDGAASTIDSLRQAMGVTATESAVIERISQRVRTTALGRDLSFGIQLCQLLEKLGFPDAEIVDGYCSSPSSWPSQRSFGSLVSYLRGCIVHEGHLPPQTDNAALTIAVYKHLLDIATRAFLKWIGYSGQYALGCGRYAGQSRPIDWVDSSSSPPDLGYKC